MKMDLFNCDFNISLQLIYVVFGVRPPLEKELMCSSNSQCNFLAGKLVEMEEIHRMKGKKVQKD